MRSHWIQHAGRQIFYCDYTNFQTSELEALKEELAAVEATICQQTTGSVLAITDVRGAVASTEALDAFKNTAFHTSKYVTKQAVVGVTGYKKVMFDALVRLSGQNAHSFDDLEQAKDWLVRD